LSLAIRLLFVGTADPHQLFTRWSTATDAVVYDQFGWNLATHGTLGVLDRPSGFAMPGYPILIACIYRVTGHLPGAVRWVQAVLGVLTVLALGAMARHLAGPRAAFLAVMAAAVYPQLVYYTGEILTECLFITAYAGMLLTALRIGERGRVPDGVFHGVCLTVAALTRPVGIVLEPAVLILARPWARENRRTRLAGLLLGFLLYGTAWGAWMIRNRHVFGETIPFDTHGGFALYLGHLESIGESQDQIAHHIGYNHTTIARGDLPGGPRGELEADRRSARKAWESIRESPQRSVRCFLRNLAALWIRLDFSEVGGGGRPVGLMTLVGCVSYLVVLVLGLGGLWRLFHDRRWAPLLAFVAAFALSSAVHAVVIGGQRYRVATLDPILLVLAAIAADAGIAALERSRSLTPFRSAR
jgi:4-amino-4-deoxy-L-arabinose transferase-like glycosyltransferase